MNHSPITTDISFRNLFLCLMLVLVTSFYGQEDYLSEAPAAIHEMQIDYWKHGKPNKVKEFKISLGDELNVKTWDGVKMNGVVKELKADSLLLGTTWLRLREVAQFKGKGKSNYTGLFLVALGAPATYYGYKGAVEVRNGFRESSLLTQILLFPVFAGAMGVVVGLAVYGVLAVVTGTASLFLGKNLNLAGHQKEMQLHTYDEMLAGMSKRELRRHLKHAQ